MKHIKILAIASLVITIYSFKEKTTPANTQTQSTASKTCRVKTKKESMNRSDSSTFSYFRSTAYEYNANGKLLKEIEYDSSGAMSSYILYDYSTTGIVDKKSFSAIATLKSHTILQLGSNGYASVSIDGDNTHDTLVIYEYNADGYLIKETNKLTGAVVINTITNGNLTQSTSTINGKTTMNFTYEYTEKPDKNSADKYFLGKGNTNLPSKWTMSGTSFDDNTAIGTFTYIMDSNGYPSETLSTMGITQSKSSMSSMQIIAKTQVTYTYYCQLE